MTSSSFRNALLHCTSALIFAPIPVSADPVPFHQQGAVPSSAVLTHTIFPQTNQTSFLETTKISSYNFAKPIMVRDAEGNLYVGNRGIVTKLSSTGVPQWRANLRRSNGLIGETTTYAERWSHTPLASGVFDYNTINTNNLFETTDPSQVVDSIEITDILVDSADSTDADDTTNTSLYIVARELSGQAAALRTYVAKISGNGRYLWRQVTTTPSYGGSDSYVSNERIQALFRSETKTLQIVESAGLAGMFGNKPATRFVQIDGLTGNRGLPISLGTTGAPLVTNTKLYSVLEMTALPGGRVALLSVCNDTLTLAGQSQDANCYRVDIFNPNTGDIEDALQFARDFGTIFEHGWLRREVTDIAASADGQLYINFFLSTYQNEYPFFNNHSSLQAWNILGGGDQPMIFSDEAAWTVNPPGNEWVSEIKIVGDHITLAGNAPPNPSQVTGWNLIQLKKRGMLSPEYLWSRVLPDAYGPYYRINAYLHDWDTDAHGNVYLLSRYAEGDTDFNTLYEGRLTYTKYSPQGDLQFFEPLDAFQMDGPARLLLNSSNTASSANAQYHRAIVVRKENPANPSDPLNFTWTYIHLEQENNVDAPEFAFKDITKEAIYDGKFINGSSVATYNWAQPLKLGEIRFDLPTTGPAWKIEVDGTLPEGMFLSDGVWEDNINAQISGPITRPYGDYPIQVIAHGTNGSTRRTFTLRHLPELAEFSMFPIDGLIAKESSHRLTSTVGNKSVAGSMRYQWQRKIDTLWQAVPGAVTESFLFKKITKTADYRLAVTNQAGTSYSPVARIIVDTEPPFVSKPKKPAKLKTSTATTQVSGTLFDNLTIKSLRYKVKVGKEPYSKFKDVDLGGSGQIRSYQFNLATKQIGNYTIFLEAKDSSGNKTAKTFVVTRK